MRRALALLAAAAGVAALFASASETGSPVVHVRLSATSNPVACYETTWSKGSKPVTQQIECGLPGPPYIVVEPASH